MTLMDSRSNAYRKLFRSGLVLVLLFVGYGLFLINRSGSGGSGAPSTAFARAANHLLHGLVDQEGEPVLDLSRATLVCQHHFYPLPRALRTHDAENAATSGSPACGGE